MAYIRQLPSGLWAATVRTPAGRITETRDLKGAVKAWADALEADIQRSEFIDPRLARRTVGDAWTTYGTARKLEQASRKRDDSHWRTWVEPRWAHVPVGSIVKPDVQAWVNELDEQLGPRRAWTTIAALNVLKAALELAVDAGWIRANPARRVRPPVPPQHVDRVIDAGEEQLICQRLDDWFPGRRDGRVFVAAMFETGARWEEAAAIRRDAVNLRAGLISLGPVMERDGTVRDYPKGARSRHSAGFRDVPVSAELLAELRPLVLATPAGGLLFTAALGGPIRYPTWLRRVWKPVVAGLDAPVPTPHDVRHTYGTRLADAGLPLHDRMALMGQRDVRSGQRYTHSGDARFEAARAALRRARG